jgi:hypothetical protein
MRDFLAFTIKFNGITNRVVTDVDFSLAFDPAKGDPQPKHFSAKALWDTGATGSAISKEIVAALGLSPVGISNVNHAGGTSTASRYVVNVYLPNKVAVAGVIVHEFTAAVGVGAFSAIIGMDIIAKGDLALTHENGKSCMSFRVPSCGQIDFVEEANRHNVASAKIGRNDPCPCGRVKPDGSPMKYKNCHGIIRA